MMMCVCGHPLSDHISQGDSYKDGEFPCRFCPCEYPKEKR